jgi:hypothetical protein
VRLGILPARIDKYLVLLAPGLSHRGYRRAEHATDRREPFTGFGACFGRGRLIHGTPRSRGSSVKWSTLLPSKKKAERTSDSIRNGLRLAAVPVGLRPELMIRQDWRMKRSSDAACAAAQVMVDRVAEGNAGRRNGNPVRPSLSCVPVAASMAVRPHPFPLVRENPSPL